MHSFDKRGTPPLVLFALAVAPAHFSFSIEYASSSVVTVCSIWSIPCDRGERTNESRTSHTKSAYTFDFLPSGRAHSFFMCTHIFFSPSFCCYLDLNLFFRALLQFRFGRIRCFTLIFHSYSTEQHSSSTIIGLLNKRVVCVCVIASDVRNSLPLAWHLAKWFNTLLICSFLPVLAAPFHTLPFNWASTNRFRW